MLKPQNLLINDAMIVILLNILVILQSNYIYWLKYRNCNLLILITNDTLYPSMITWALSTNKTFYPRTRSPHSKTFYHRTLSPHSKISFLRAASPQRKKNFPRTLSPPNPTTSPGVRGSRRGQTHQLIPYQLVDVGTCYFTICLWGCRLEKRGLINGRNAVVKGD